MCYIVLVSNLYYRNLTLTVVHHLAALSRLFPNTFNEKLCEQLFAHLTKWLETALQKHTNTTGGQQSDSQVDVSRELELCAAILEIFHLIPLAPQVISRKCSKTAIFENCGNKFLSECPFQHCQSQ